MIITNVPYLMSQILLFYAENVYTLYACSIMMGLSVGFSGGPFSAYVGEVCEPKLRGALMSATNVFYFSGLLLFSSIYSVTRQWRLTVLISMVVPVITIAILFVVSIRTSAPSHQHPTRTQRSSTDIRPTGFFSIFSVEPGLADVAIEQG